MTVTDTTFSEMAAALEQHPDYRVLRRLRYRDNFLDAGDQPTRIGVVLDVETTGLDTSSDEVIELGMVKFTYLPSGEIVRIVDTFSSLNEPIKSIPSPTRWSQAKRSMMTRLTHLRQTQWS